MKCSFRKAIEYCKKHLSLCSGRSKKSYNAAGNVDSRGLAQDISEANTYIVSSWVAGHSLETLKNDLAIFFPRPDNLCKAKLERLG